MGVKVIINVFCISYIVLYLPSEHVLVSFGMENKVKIIPAMHAKPWGTGSRTNAEQIFLEGPHSRTFEFLHAFQVFFEMLYGFRRLHFVGACVTVFGSARFNEQHPFYELAREVGRELAKRGFVVMTGGGPGIMEAANRGAKDIEGRSVGCNITLPKEQVPNPYLDSWLEFKYFMVRKFTLAKYTYGFIAMPGGFGTLDELFEILTLIQTGKMKNFPIVLVGIEFWHPLKDLIEKRLLFLKMINQEDFQTLFFTDSPKEAADFILNIAKDQFQIHERKRPRPFKFLGEKQMPL